MEIRKFGRILCTGLYFFFSGVEYVVILPTLNGYLNLLDAPTGFLGIVLATFSFAGLLTTPIYGLLADKMKSSKPAIVVSNFFEIAGNLLYFIGQNFYLVWISRFVSGIGSGSASAIIATVARTTKDSERTSVLSAVMSMRQFGLVIGPATNLIFHNLHSAIGPFSINQFTSPGLFMAAVWVFHTVLIVFLYHDETEDVNSEISDSRNNAETSTTLSRRTLYSEFIREEVVVCISITFMVMFVQLGLESALTPLTLLAFGWGGLFNSYLYCGLGLVIAVAFATLTICSRRYEDRNLIIIGIFNLLLASVMFLAYSTVLFFSRNELETPNWLLPVFLLDIAIYAVGLPFTSVPMTSLYSKITSMESQGFNQGLRLVALGIGQILGPIWAAPLATFRRLPYLAFVNTFLTALLLAMVIASYNKMVKTSCNVEARPPEVEIECDEGTSLVG